MERLTIEFEGLTREEAELSLNLSKLIKAHGFAKGFASRCPQCVEFKGECKDEGERPGE